MPKKFTVDRRYWIPDADFFDQLEEKEKGSLTFLDDCFLEMYRSSSLDHCAFCGGRLYRRVVFHSAGHYNFCYVRFRCFDCPLDVEMSADHVNTYQDADDLYVSYCSQLKSAIKEDHHAN